MHGIEVILGLLVVVLVLVTLARRIAIPYPTLLVVGGLILSFLPGLPHVELEPELVLVIFLPPLLQEAAFFTSWRAFRANLRPISLLAIGLVFTTTASVALVAHALIPGWPWAAAFVLGAVVSPPDAVAVTALTERIKLPRRVVTILEGESLVNDSTALVAYRLAVAAGVSGSFAILDAGISLVTVAVGGVLLGLAIGWGAVQLLRRIDDPPIEIAITLLLPFAAYLPAEALHVSGVLAVVTSGLYVGQQSPLIMSSQTRIQAGAVWDIITFLLNGFIFILIGLQLPSILSDLTEYSLGELLLYGAAISLTVVVVRVLWVWPATYLPRLLVRRIRERDPAPPWQPVTIVSWAGMRGVVSLATALALPRTTAGGEEFPGRELIIFLTFCVILVTLVGQALTLPALIRWLGIRDDGLAEREELQARLRAAQAVAARLDEHAQNPELAPELVGDLRIHYQQRAARYQARLGEGDASEHETRAAAHQHLLRDLLNIERDTLLELRAQGAIHDEVLHQIQHELDLEELRLEKV